MDVDLFSGRSTLGRVEWKPRNLNKTKPASRQRQETRRDLVDHVENLPAAVSWRELKCPHEEDVRGLGILARLICSPYESLVVYLVVEHTIYLLSSSLPLRHVQYQPVGTSTFTGAMGSSSGSRSHVTLFGKSCAPSSELCFSFTSTSTTIVNWTTTSGILTIKPYDKL